MPPIRLVEIHPILVHFPIALLILIVLLDFLALFLRRAHLVEAATWCLGFGALDLLAAELSGNVVEDHVKKALVRNLLEMHTTFALITVITFITLFALCVVWLSPVFSPRCAHLFPRRPGSNAPYSQCFPSLGNRLVRSSVFTWSPVWQAWSSCQSPAFSVVQWSTIMGLAHHRR